MDENKTFLPYIVISDWLQKQIKCEEIDGRLTCHARLRSPWIDANPLKGLALFFLALPCNIFRWHTFFHKNNTQAINIHYPTQDCFIFLLMRWAYLFHGKVILSLHGTDLENIKMSKKINRLVWNFIFAAADCIVVCSADLGKRFTLSFPQYESKLTLIHNGIDFESMQRDQDNTFELEARFISTPYILSIGTFSHIKGQDILIKAFAKIAIKNIKLHLIIIGRYSDQLASITQLIRNLNLEDRVTLLTDVAHKRIHAFMQHALLFALPSRSEALPIVLLEAAAYGLPVIATNVGGIPEIIEHGVTGRLFEPEDIAGLENGITILIDDNEASLQLGTALKSKVFEYFRWADAYEKYMQLVH